MSDTHAIEQYLCDIRDSLDSIATSLTVIAIGQQQRNIPRFLGRETLVEAAKEIRDVAIDIEHDAKVSW